MFFHLFSFGERSDPSNLSRNIQLASVRDMEMFKNRPPATDYCISWINRRSFFHTVKGSYQIKFKQNVLNRQHELAVKQKYLLLQ